MDNFTLDRIMGCSVNALLSQIAAARRDAGISQARVGGVLGVSRQTISNWERHRAIPSACYLLALCSLFNINPLVGVEFEVAATSNWDGQSGSSWVSAKEVTRLTFNGTFVL